jgi:hypothetical protein
MVFQLIKGSMGAYGLENKKTTQHTGNNIFSFS